MPLASFLSSGHPRAHITVPDLNLDEWRAYPHDSDGCCLACDQEASAEYQVFCSDECGRKCIDSFKGFVQNVPSSMKSLHDRIELATQFPDITTNPLWFSRAIRQVQGTYHMHDKEEDIWERDASKGMWQVVLDVWLKSAIEFDTPIKDLPLMFTPPNDAAGAQYYS